jgi:deazaflavin-dependent oxidoreductase (nitroreductase family)
MRRLLVMVGLVSAGGAAVAWWRRHPRFGASWINRVVDPWLVRQGIVEKSQGEIGLLEHVGRSSGIVRVTPVHPVPTQSGYRIIVPLGGESHWARNVMAAGHCRIQVGETIHELDEPILVSPLEVPELPPTAARVMDWLGFRYLLLRRFAEAPGTLDVAPEKATPVPDGAAEPEPLLEAPTPAT